MFRYVIKRILIFIPTLFVISLAVFMLSKLAPGDPVLNMIGNPEEEDMDPRVYQEERKKLGLDLPIFYFSFSTAASSDTLYRIPQKLHRDNLQQLVNTHGNWAQISHYYQTIVEFRKTVANIKRDSLNRAALIPINTGSGDLLIRFKERDVNKALSKIGEAIDSTPDSVRSVKDLSPYYQEVEQAYQSIQENASPWKNKIPAIRWYGFNNQYHRWLFGNRPLIQRRAVIQDIEFPLSQSEQYTFTIPDTSFYRFRLSIPASALKLSSARTEVLAIRRVGTDAGGTSITVEDLKSSGFQIKKIVPFNAGEQVRLIPTAYAVDIAATCRLQVSNLVNYNPNLGGGFLRLDFGRSYQDKRPIAQKIGDYLYWTVVISIISIILTYIFSIPLGVFSARRKGTVADGMATTVLFILYSLPSFWVATLLITFLCQPDYLNWFPAFGLGEVPEGASWGQRFQIRAYHLILPLICWTYGSLAFLSRQMRGGMLGVLRQDFIRTARAKGLTEQKVVWKHAFRNSLLPVITLFGNVFPRMISGSIVIEVIFSIPGMGNLLFEAIRNQDHPVVFTIVLMVALMTMIGYLIADLLYAVVDPRIAYK